MAEIYTKARFWKCALQVNPAGYIATYQGKEQKLTEDEYNLELLRICREEQIKIIGIANHGNVSGINAIQHCMDGKGIVVFPGFEIATTEKAHFVCLFPEDTPIDKLERYLGGLGITDPERGTMPSTLGGNELIKKIHEYKGFCYAAHCTDEHGILKLKLSHVWKDPLLRAAQIPCALDEIHSEGCDYVQILKNVNPDYRRKNPMGLIQAKDIDQPDTLRNPHATCLIRMTEPSFKTFVTAFQDPESRIRLNSDVSEPNYSRLETIQITGGYLDGLSVEFADHLNTIIGGRGTGKSTLLECIRYVLGLRPIGRDAAKQHDQIISANIGASKARIEVTVRSWKMNGKRFTISRKYPDDAYVRDEHGTISSFTPADILPTIEIFGQNEIFDIARDSNAQRKLLARFLDSGQECDTHMEELLGALKKNRKKLIEATDQASTIEDDLARLPKLEEEISQYKSLGIEDTLRIIPLLGQEKRLRDRIEREELPAIHQVLDALEDAIPDTAFLTDHAIATLPHRETLRKIKSELDRLAEILSTTHTTVSTSFTASQESIAASLKEIESGIRKEEMHLEEQFKELPSSAGKTGKEIGTAYQRLLIQMERIKPMQTSYENQKRVVNELKKQRESLLADLAECRASHSAQVERSLKKLRKQLAGQLKVSIQPEADRKPLMEFLMGCGLDGVGEKRLTWILDQDEVTPTALAKLIEAGSESLLKANWGMTPTTAQALSKLTFPQILALQEIQLPDLVVIELNVSHAGEEVYRTIDRLSTGQQCTAILHLLLLQNNDPLIMDQPEDNLDNAFIADRIVSTLRSEKLNRQFLFATHNANIPVFGDAEWIGVLEASEDQATMDRQRQGAIDMPLISKKAAEILEGGETAFIQRKEKYGF